MKSFSARAQEVSRRVRALGALAIGLSLLLHAGSAAAAPSNTAAMNLQVTFAGSLSVSIDAAAYSTRTLAAGANALVIAGSATVVNDSAGFIERWQLSVSTVSGDGDWAVIGSTATPPDVDQYAFQALFISSATSPTNQPGSWANGCPASNASDWDSYASTVTATAAFYNSAMYADQAAVGGASGIPDELSGTGNGNMQPASTATDGRGTRGLCTRIYMPAGTEVVTQPQVIRLNITAVPGG